MEKPPTSKCFLEDFFVKEEIMKMINYIYNLFIFIFFKQGLGIKYKVFFLGFFSRISTMWPLNYLPSSKKEQHWATTWWFFFNYNYFKKELVPSGRSILCLPLRRNSIGWPHGGLKKLQIFFLKNQYRVAARFFTFL